MGYLKIVVGCILLISNAYSLTQLSGGMRVGAGLVGALTGFFLMGALSIWLIDNGVKQIEKKEDDKRKKL